MWGFGLRGGWVGPRGLEVNEEELKKGGKGHTECFVFLQNCPKNDSVKKWIS